MAKRGRPKANGQKDGWVFIRSCVALCALDKARRNGEKYETAISDAILAVHPWGMRISRTEVKRLLAARQLENPTQTLRVTEDPPDGSNQASANGAGLPPSRPRRLAFGFALPRAPHATMRAPMGSS